MPVPNTPLTTSVGRVASAPANACVANDMVPTTLDTQAPPMSSQWEEPHPGRPFSYQPVGGGNASRGAGQDQGVRAKGDGMAAKGYSPYPTRGSAGLRRPARSGIKAAARPGLLKPLRIQVNKMGGDIRRSVSIRARPKHSRASATTAPIVAENLAPITTEMDLDTTMSKETMVDANLGLPSSINMSGLPTPSSEGSSPRLSMVDFPDHLMGPCAADELRQQHKEMVDSCASSQDEDPYGWEAELSRRVQTVGDCYTLSSPRHKRAGARRSLLHRVFNNWDRERA